MSKVTVLGAGAMGSALCTPLQSRGHQVALWGTWLDDAFLPDYSGGAPHPGTGVPVPDQITVFGSDQLTEALAGSDLVIIAIASQGVYDVARMAAPHLEHQPDIALVSKGFFPLPTGSIGLMPEAVRAGLGRPDASLVAVGGPCKANEVAAGQMTVTSFASRDGATAQKVSNLMRTDTYRPHPGNDEAGVEVAAALKNVFAIALGVADGLELKTGVPWHNLKAAVFARAIAEMALIAQALGGDPKSVYGLSGVGDLEVTGLSGRNKVYGSRLGAGEAPEEALAAMRAAGQTVEGVSACDLAVQLAGQLQSIRGTDLRLLHAIRAMLSGADPKESLTQAL